MALSIARVSPDGNRTRITTVKELCLNHLTTGPFYSFIFLFNLIPLLVILKYNKTQCKYRTYFYRLQNGCITFMLTRLKYNISICVSFSIIYN